MMRTSIKCCLLALWLGIALLVPSAWAASQVMRVGITAFRDKDITVHEWQPTMDFLSQQLPDLRFEAVPLALTEFQGAMKARTLDFVITNPEHYIVLEHEYGASRAATLVKSEGGVIVNRFGGVIFAAAGRNDISTLGDIKGKRVVAIDKTSFAAYLIQYDMLKEQGIDLSRDCTVEFTGFPQDRAVIAVLAGQADIGFVRSGLLESMAREGKLDLAAVKIIHQVQPRGFPFLLSSDLYPEWPLAVASHVSVDITNRVVAALLLMPPDSPAARSARYYRWSTPVEYQSVQALMERRHIYPFDQPPRVTVRDVLREYAVPILVGAWVVLVVMGWSQVRAYRLNQALRRSRHKLSELAYHDALTGLPNRSLLEDRLEHALAQHRRTPRSLALCMLDLDGFKPINDSLGHAVGDLVLREVALRIKTVLREGDTVARVGGDEFVLLVVGFENESRLHDIIDRVLTAVARDYPECHGLPVRASVGVSVLGADAHDSTTLMRHADEAMYQAKAAGGGRYIQYVASGQGNQQAPEMA